eukprot:GFUD01064502.1.p1 GENE.GFUD01064502.1~~GFUD01064502.1.p1  ORF type:complete len:272 (-),score=66.79 GFUD01064502.1:225-1040(-)
MERWVKVLLGTFFGSLGSFIFFLIFDRILQHIRRMRTRGVEEKNGGDSSIHMRVKLNKDKANREEMEKLVYEEYDTEKHEVLAICMETPTIAVGISLFMNDREAEYYWEKFPECCVKHTSGDDFIFRNLMTAVSYWGSKWTMAEAVNFLVQSGNLVRNVSKGTTRQWRAVNQFEEKHSFRFFIQWTDNYVCDEVCNDELWEELVNLAKQLVNSSETELESAWENFPVEHWKRKRVRVNGINFHLVPHPGDIATMEVDKPVEVTDDLVEYLR